MFYRFRLLYFLILLMLCSTAEATCTDVSFVKAYIQYLKNPKIKKTLLKHPALQTIVRHRKMTGSKNATPENTLKIIIKKKQEIKKLENILSYVGKNEVICDLWKESAKTLFKDFRFTGHIYFVVGYDIGAAIPPDVLINLSHPKFLKNPTEIEPIIIHEMHHLGFFQNQKIPSLSDLEKPKNLLRLIKWATHTEGMAVHSAYAYRKRKHILDQDDDYKIYFDEQEKEKCIKEYTKWVVTVRKAEKQINHINLILSEMSSQNRLWYKFGAIVANSIENKQGTSQLIQSILEPHIFWQEAKKIMKLH